jgi:hypothetical protein
LCAQQRRHKAPLREDKKERTEEGEKREETILEIF